MNIVIDTNVVASAIFFGGKPRELIELLLMKRFDSFVTKEIIDEYIETIDYLKDKYQGKNINIPINHIISCVHCIESVTKVDICRDPDDNKFIECAIDGKCLYVVSGDKDLLSIGEVGEVEIVTVSEFLNRYNK